MSHIMPIMHSTIPKTIKNLLIDMKDDSVMWCRCVTNVSAGDSEIIFSKPNQKKIRKSDKLFTHNTLAGTQ